MQKNIDIRQFVELCEEVDEINYFLKEWRRLKQMEKGKPAKVLEDPEMRFLTRTLERLIMQAQDLEMPLILSTSSELATSSSQNGSTTGIELTECLRVSRSGKDTSYVGNSKGLLSLIHLADVVAGGGSIMLLNAPQ